MWQILCDSPSINNNLHFDIYLSQTPSGITFATKNTLNSLVD